MIFRKNDEIFFHEDFYRQIELIPEENYFSSTKYISDLSTREISDYGFTSASDRSKHNLKSIKTESRLISFSDFEKTIEPLAFDYFTNITTGYGNTILKKENTVAWGFEVYGIFAEYNKDQIITNIWLCQSSFFNRNRTVQKLYRVLNTIGLKYKLVLVDWDQNIVVRICNEIALIKYLEDNFDLKVLY